MHVVATAGHVDHGKSTLIRALTGMEPDRWAEERRRGMTIDLGYAWLTLPDGNRIAFVDVPGHHRFISNMLAGIGPVPAVLLVVAADEGWARQTTEHLAALEALGVRHGVLAVTRSDLAEPETAIAEARDHLAGTGLAGVEAVAVSGTTGAGLDRLREALARMAAALPQPTSSATRLWVDRVFTVRGAGTVVTGTLSSGRIVLDDELVLSGDERPVRVRGLQSLNTPVDEASAVARVAVNLRGVKPDEVRRGQALLSPGRWAQPETVDVRLIGTDGPPPSQAIVHVGSAAVLARVRPLGDDDTVRLRLDHPLPLHVGDRAILRDPGRQRVIGGLVVLDTDPPALARRGSAARRGAQLAAVSVTPDAAGEVARRGAVHRAQLVAAGVLEPDAPTPTGARAIGPWLIAEDRWQHWRTELAAALDRQARDNPMAPGAPRAVLVARLGVPDATVLDALVRDSPGLTVDDAGVRRRDAPAALPPAALAALEELEQRLAEHPFTAPERGDLATAGLTETHLAIAVRTGRLVRIAAGIYLRPDAVDNAVRRLSSLPQPFTLSQARQALDTTRRVAVPLLELLDRAGHTQRVDGQLRSLRV